MKGGKRKKKSKGGSGGLGGIYSFGSVIDLQNASQLVGAQSLTETSVLDHPAAKVFQENNLSSI